MASAEPLRLQKFLAQAGLASRREAERLIAAGRVTLNGAVVTEMGLQIDPLQDAVCLDGRPVRARVTATYLMLHKPVGFLVTRRDTHARATVYDLLPPAFHSLHPVGRLDGNSSGLLLLTDDGELTQRLLHPRYHVEKRYLVDVSAQVRNEQLQILRHGIRLEEGLTQPADIRLIRRSESLSHLEFRLKEGKKRQIRRMCAAMGWDVQSLHRQDFGPLRLNLPAGKFRLLEASEIALLRRAAGLE